MTLEIREIAWRDPAAAFACWAAEPYLAWLDSGGPAGGRSRYSYLAVEPFQVLTAAADGVRLDGRPVPGDPFAALDRELARWRLPPGAGPVPFATGAVGCFAYELARHLDRHQWRHADDLAIPELVVGFYDLVLAWDHLERRAWILASGLPLDGAAGVARAAARLEQALHRLEAAPAALAVPSFHLAWRAELARPDYQARVVQILELIRSGEIYQANFTARHLAEHPPELPAPALYLALRAASPAPFAAYLGCGERLAIASASPERFLSLDSGGRIETRPIKGTRPRGKTAEEDAWLADELSASAKDRAENLMIVDLMRNDIGRVAVTGSVAVERLCQLESFAQVHHLVSAVSGRLPPGKGAVDLLRACFPGGSVTGAPKLRAMTAIDALEAARRGPYCGAIAWFGLDGAMDSSIVIRSLTITPERIVAQAGGGIVADSDPAAEYEEMMVKLRPLLLGGTLEAP